MITKFKDINESNIDLTDIEINIDNKKDKFVDRIIQDLSIISYKKAKNPKTIRIISITGYFNKKDFRTLKLLYDTNLIVTMSNGDRIDMLLSVYKNRKENNIKIKINNELIFDLDNENFNNNYLIEKTIVKYKEQLLKTVKIR